MLMNERILKNLIKQDEDFQKFAIGRDIGDAEGEERGKALGLQEGKTIGLQEGKTIGIQQNQHDMILEMHKKGLPIDLITDISKLSKSEVNAIINENSNKIKK